MHLGGTLAEVRASEHDVVSGRVPSVPFMLLAGERDQEAGAVSFRFRDGTQVNEVPVDEAVAKIVEWVRSRRNESPTAELLAPAEGTVGTA